MVFEGEHAVQSLDSVRVQHIIRFMRHWGLLAVALALAAGIGTYVLTRTVVRPVYSATVDLQVQLGMASGGSSYVSDPLSDNAFAQTEAQVAQERPNVRQAVSLARATSGLSPRRATIDGVGCSASGLTALFSCTVKAHDPHFAAAVPT